MSDWNTIEEKQQARERKQNLKLQCLESALRFCSISGNEQSVVETAKTFYEFVRK